jgi:hypothetical protein
LFAAAEGNAVQPVDAADHRLTAVYAGATVPNSRLQAALNPMSFLPGGPETVFRQPSLLPDVWH